MKNYLRSSGVLLHITSLPGPYGIGEIGSQAKWFIDVLVTMNQKYWQFLPTNYPENYHSPYDTNSAFAQNPLLISLDNLLEQDLIKKRDLSPTPDFSGNKVEFEKLIKWKIPILRKAASKFSGSSKEKLEQYEKYCFENSFWLEDYALFMVLKEKNDNKSWLEWDENSKNLDPKHIEMVKRKEYVTTEEEPLFDAADILRFGKDLIVQHGFTTNLKGIDWLKRHFPDHRVHTVNFPGDPYPIHIDATFTPIKPGLILNNPVRKLPKEQRKLFEDNGWEIVYAAQPAHNSPPDLSYYSIWLSMNVLVLDPKTVCVEKTEVYQAEQLDKLGMEVIPIDFREVYAFGGSLHCSTTDVFREGDLQNYFPKQ